MLSITNKTSLTIREIGYSIQIRDRNSSFERLRELLRNELTKYGESNIQVRPESANPIQEFLRSNIERSIITHENTQIYFINYREKEGSLRIEFTLLVITSDINFPPTRQALDYLIKDTIVDYFEEILERHINVNITFEASDKEVVNFAGSVAGKKAQIAKPRRDLFTRIVAIAALVIALIIGAAFMYKAINTNSQKENAKLKEEYIDLLLEKKIIEAVKDQKFTIKLYKIADTTGTNHNPSAQPKVK